MSPSTPSSSFPLYLVLVLAVVVVSDPCPYPQVVSNCIFCDPSEPSDNQPTSTSKCVSDSNFSPEGDRSNINADLSSYIAQDKNGKPLLPSISGSPGQISNNNNGEIKYLFSPHSALDLTSLLVFHIA